MVIPNNIISEVTLMSSSPLPLLSLNFPSGGNNPAKTTKIQVRFRIAVKLWSSRTPI